MTAYFYKYRKYFKSIEFWISRFVKNIDGIVNFIAR